MDRQLINDLRDLLSEFVKEKGFVLIDISCNYPAKRATLKIMLDRSCGGITLDDCAWLNNQISEFLDAKNLIQTSYILEVSSPGLDRPLKDVADFQRCLSKKIVVYTSSAINDKTEHRGTIKNVEGNSLYLESNGQVIVIALAEIKKAIQLIEE
jgi:ribosome maturation factor RimP